MLYPTDMDLETRRTVFMRKLICWYILCSAKTYAARGERHVETRVLLSHNYFLILKRQLYLAASEYSTHFRTQLKALDNPMEDSARKDMTLKHSFLLLMTFEGAVKMQDWGPLRNIIQVTAYFSPG
jgi:hypothetical protein